MASPIPDVQRVLRANSAQSTDNGMANSGSRWTVYAALTAATCFWGVGFAVARFALRSVTPLELLAGQSLAAALAQIVWILALRRGASLRLPRTLFAVVAALGLLGHNILNALTFFGLARTTATNAALIYGFSPIMIALLAAWFLREPLGGRAAMAALVGLAGVALIITQGHAEAVRLRGMMAGNLLVFAGAAYWSGYSVATRSITRRVSAETYTFYLLVLGAIAPVSWVWMTERRFPLAGLEWPTLLAVCFFGVSTGTLSMNFWNWGLARIEASRVGVFSYLEPVFAAAVAITFLGERPTLATALGAALVFAGVFLSAKTRAKGLAE